ncbi:MAG: hypothetical protein GDA51_08925 [Ekhidna sp.]|nr:hypothetical protein [Ekhidna sp.]
MKKLILLYLAFLISSYYIFSQICGTPHPTNPTVYFNSASSRTSGNSEFCIDVFFHIVRNTNGTNAFTLPYTDAIVRELNKFYSPHNIVINNAGTSFINNSNFINIGDKTEAKSLGQINNRSDAVNYYIVKTLWNTNRGTIVGTANSIPSNNLVIRSDRVLTSISPHELGHCLDLLHTHETARGVKRLDGSNCHVAGDWVCDTPADSGQGAVNGYKPDLTNLMSYYHNFGFTLDHFTKGQGRRMRMALDNKPILSDITSHRCVRISKVDNVCYPQTKIITLSNLGGFNTVWSSSSNVQIISSNNNSVTVRAKSSYSTGNGWIKAALSNGVVLQEGFSVGVPNGRKISIENGSGSDVLYNQSWNWIYVQYNGSSNILNNTWEWRFLRTSGDVRVMVREGNNKSLNLVTVSGEGTLNVHARVSNECGCSLWKDTYFQVRRSLSRGGRLF